MFHTWVPALTAGFVAVLVGFASSAVIVFQAAAAAGATPEQLGSWMLALCIGMGLTSIGLSLRYRVPVLTAWSTPGAALLATTLPGLPMAQAIGAFVVCGALIVLVGVTGWFERVMNRIPVAIASAMLVGVLLKFGLEVFVAMKTEPWMVLAMFVVYLVGRRFMPRYTVPLVLLLGMVIAAVGGTLKFELVRATLVHPVAVMPAFSWSALIGVAVPLFVVTMASQNIPGVATLRANGYQQVPISPLITWTGVATLLLAPFGGFALNLAAITAAICMGREAHEDPSRRYWAAVAAGGFYLAVGLLGATVVSLFAAFPKELVWAVAGLALLGTIGSGLAQAMADEKQREPALITLLVTASGISLAGVGAAFWGLVAGAVAMLVLTRRR